MQPYYDLDKLGRVQLSPTFYMRDFLFSEIGSAFGILNVPDDVELAIHTGRELCERLLEPLQQAFGRLHVRSGYRSSRMNAFGNKRGLNCSSNARTYGDHIWDRRDAAGNAGACACVVIPWFLARYGPEEWERLAWWLWDSPLEFHRVVFFGKQAAFNIGWRENPVREVLSHSVPRGRLTGPGLLNGAGDHRAEYPGFPAFVEPVSASAAANRARTCNPLHGLGEHIGRAVVTSPAFSPPGGPDGARAYQAKEGLRVQR